MQRRAADFAIFQFPLCRLRSVRFEQPYEHTLRVPGEAGERKLSIQQAPLDAQGFASTGEARFAPCHT